MTNGVYGAAADYLPAPDGGQFIPEPFTPEPFSPGQFNDKTDPGPARPNGALRGAEREVLPELRRTQAAIDVVDVASMDSFPCSDPPGYTACHA